MNAARALGAALSLFVGIISPLFAQEPGSAPPAAPKTSSLVREVLPGGLRLLIEPRKSSSLTAMEIRVRVGSGRERPGENGLAHFVEHMVLKGSANHPSGGIDADMEKLGGEISARTTRESTHFSTVVPAGQWKAALALFAEALLSPTFTDADRATEARVIAAEMAVARTDPEKHGFSRLASVAYDRTDPAHLPLMGSPDSVAAVTSPQLAAFHRKWYRPENITIVLVGDIAPEEARKFVGFLFRGGPRPPQTGTGEATVYAPLGRIVRATPVPPSEQKGRPLTTVLVAFRAPSVRSDDSLPAFDTLMPILANGRLGRLTERLVRKEGVALSVAADFIPGHQVSLILFTLVTTPKRSAIAERSLIEELRRLREDQLTEAETDRAVGVVLGRVAYGARSVAERASWLASLDLAAPLLDPDTYVGRVSKMKVDELNRLVETYLTTLSYAVAEIGPPPPPPDPEESAASGVAPDGEAGR
ncbi:MAG: pitrilysin family protein [Capsulimonadales bacterium]|nr:pitrilysin family protein [Capsulimonadales bacterium]